jgi:hypothetical protein
MVILMVTVVDQIVVYSELYVFYKEYSLKLPKASVRKQMKRYTDFVDKCQCETILDSAIHGEGAFLTYKDTT